MDSQEELDGVLAWLIALVWSVLGPVFAREGAGFYEFILRHSVFSYHLVFTNFTFLYVHRIASIVRPCPEGWCPVAF